MQKDQKERSLSSANMANEIPTQKLVNFLSTTLNPKKIYFVLIYYFGFFVGLDNYRYIRNIFANFMVFSMCGHGFKLCVECKFNGFCK